MRAAARAKAKTSAACAAMPPIRRGLWAPLLLLTMMGASAQTDVGQCHLERPTSVVCPLNSSQTMEYELRWSHGWQWFVLPTADAAAVSIGLVMQRGSSRNFPRMGFVAMASSSGVPPATLSVRPWWSPTTGATRRVPVAWALRAVEPKAVGLSYCSSPLLPRHDHRRLQRSRLQREPKSPLDQPLDLHVPIS